MAIYTHNLPAWKREEVEQIKELAQSHELVGLVNIYGIPAKQFPFLLGKGFGEMQGKHRLLVGAQGGNHLGTAYATVQELPRRPQILLAHPPTDLIEGLGGFGTESGMA